MSFIDSSTAASPLAMAAAGVLGPPPEEIIPDDELDLETEDEQEDDRAEEADQGPPTGLKKRLIAWTKNINIAREVDEEILRKIGQAVTAEYDIDENSRADWLRKQQEGMAYAQQEAKEKTSPWPGASNMIVPVLTDSALQFGAVTYPAVIVNKNVVKGQVWGSDRGTPVMEDGKPVVNPGPPGPDGQPTPVPEWLVEPGEKQARADRIGEHMSYQLLDEMPEWEPQTDAYLHQMALSGGFVRKTFYEPAERRNYSLAVSLTNIAWNYHAPSFESAPRITELLLVYPHEIKEKERAGRDGADDEGMWLEYEYGVAGDTTTRFEYDEEVGDSSGEDPAEPHTFLEQHRRWDLDGDGYDEPYVITVHKQTSNVVRIVADYDEETITMASNKRDVQRIERIGYYTLYPFLPALDGSSYPTGFVQLLKPLNDGINTTINQMLDAGTLANTGGGFIGDRMNMASGQVMFQVGRFVRVNTGGQDIRSQILPFPFSGPNSALLELLGVLKSMADKTGSIQNVLTGEAGLATASPTTVLALIQQGLKVYTAIVKRVLRSMGLEFEKLRRLNAKHIKDIVRFQRGDAWCEISPEDYRLGGGVRPIADPNMITDMQKLARAQVLAGFTGNPHVNQAKIPELMLEAAGFDRKDLNDIMVPPDSEQAAAAKQMQEAEIGLKRAQMQQAATQAYLNLAKAQTEAGKGAENWIESQMEYLRLQIEGLNVQVRAATVDAKREDIDMKRVATDARNAIDGAKQGRSETRDRRPSPGGPGAGGGGMGPMAGPPGDQGVPPTPGGSGGQFALDDYGPMGGGGAQGPGV